MIGTNTKRLEFIDGMRGLAIFTVVYFHMFFFIPKYPPSDIRTLIMLFFLNGFFFISGFVGTKIGGGIH